MTAHDRIESALCRSALFEVLALGFRPPTPERVSRLATAEAVIHAAAALDPSLGPSLSAVVTAAPTAEAATYADLFGHTVRGAVPAFETEYGVDDTFRQPHELADLAGFYRAFGLVPSGTERPDHVSCECEFAMFLARREAVAIEADDEEAYGVVHTATRLFLRDHLARFLPAFAQRLRRSDPGGFYAALANLADALVRHEAARFDVPLGGEGLSLRPITDDDAVPIACGSCALREPVDAD